MIHLLVAPCNKAHHPYDIGYSMGLKVSNSQHICPLYGGIVTIVPVILKKQINSKRNRTGSIVDGIVGEPHRHIFVIVVGGSR